MQTETHPTSADAYDAAEAFAALQRAGGLVADINSEPDGFRVLVWDSENDARNDDGSRASAAKLFSVDETAGGWSHEQ